MPAFLRRHWAALLWPAFALAATAFYSIPLFSPNASIHWDLADISYPAQKFFADSVHSWKLPQWTPYLDSGIPFLADPRTGAWYPLNWPFFLMGIAPRTLFWELALHAFLAMGGTYLLARKLIDAAGPALLASLFYAWGAYFAAHASLINAFEVGAWLPWLILGALRALESSGVRWIAFTGLILGLIVLAGDYPAALESFAALVFAAAAAAFSKRGSWKRAAALIIPAGVLALMLGGLQALPAMVLSSQSHPPPGMARFQFRELATLVAGDYYNLISGLYSGPGDPRQYYLYSGLLLIPLAIAGFVRRERWLVLLAILAPAVIFEAFRPPGDAWFPAGLALALAAGSGAMWIEQRMERPRLWVVLALVTVIDLWFWNIYKNPLVFAHAKFADIYGQSPGPTPRGPLGRTWARFVPVGNGPEDGSLITHNEATYGSGLAELDRYKSYLAAAEKNMKLLNGLAATDFLVGRNRRLDNPDALSRVTAPAHVDFAADRAAALSALAALDPATAAVVEAPARALDQSVRSVSIVAYTGDFYRIKYAAGGDSFLRIAIPYYPGWTASVDSAPTPVFAADEALAGVFVPGGDHELTLRFEPPKFLFGVSLTAAGVIALAIGLILT